VTCSSYSFLHGISHLGSLPGSSSSALTLLYEAASTVVSACLTTLSMPRRKCIYRTVERACTADPLPRTPVFLCVVQTLSRPLSLLCSRERPRVSPPAWYLARSSLLHPHTYAEAPSLRLHVTTRSCSTRLAPRVHLTSSFPPWSPACAAPLAST
jgi:hypothetical protein